MTRFSFGLTTLIIALATVVFWQDHRHLAELKSTHARLLAVSPPAARLPDPAKPEGITRHTSQARAHLREIDQKAVAGILRSYQEAAKLRAQDGTLDKLQGQQLIDQHYLITALSGSQLKLLIAQALESRDLSKECLGSLLDDAVFMLAEDDPQAALQLLDRVVNLFSSTRSAQSVVQVSLSRWAKDDPQAAGRWIREHREIFPNLITNDDKLRVVSQAAIRDPGLAFALFRDLEAKDTNLACTHIIRAVRTEQHDIAVLGALREHLATMPDQRAQEEILQSAMFQFAAQLSQTGFDAASRWIASARLTPVEFDAFTRVHAVFYNESRNRDNGRWIEWFAANLPAEKAESHIRSHMERWTDDDYQAAGTWLTTAPDGNSKNIAIRSYAETVSKHDPETAAQWVMTHPPGKERDFTLRSIHRNWPKDNPAGAAAFAKEHGIK
jgi:hypothetical protein